MKVEKIGPHTLILADAAEVISGLKGNAVVTDPPYGLGERSGTVSIERNRNAYASFNDTREAIANTIVPIVISALGVCGGRGVITPGGKCAFLYPEPVDIGCLYQPATCSLTHWGRATTQPVLFYGKDPQQGRRIQNIHFLNTGKPEDCGHPCPKPIGVARWMVERASVPGEVVIDPFMGSGTTGVACSELGRIFVGVEIEPAYFEIACERVDRAERQARLFA